MNRIANRTQALALALFICVASGGLAATVKTKSGEVLNGTIDGVVVQKLSEPATGELAYRAKYALTEGKDILSIDEQGVLADGYVTMFQAGADKPLDDLALASEVKRTYQGGLVLGLTGSIGMTVGAKLGKPVKSPLVGTLHLSSDKDVYELVATIRLSSDAGTKEIPIQEIATFDP